MKTYTGFPTLVEVPKSGLQASPITAYFQNRRDKNYFQEGRGETRKIKNRFQEFKQFERVHGDLHLKYHQKKGVNLSPT